MNTVRLYTIEGCGLCKDVEQLLHRLQREFTFQIDRQILTEEHPDYNAFVLEVPLVIINGGTRLSGLISERGLRDGLRQEMKASTSWYVRLSNLFKT
jgi:glutaredoxin